MTAMTKVNRLTDTALTVGQVAERFDVTARTLHHYDAIGLLVPSGRTTAGYRLYTGEDITRLQDVVVYGRLGFALEEIALLLDGPTADVGVRIKADMEASGTAFVTAMEAGLPATSDEAVDAAEQARVHIERWFYDITPEFHRGLGDMYIADPRFTKTYEDSLP